MTKARANPKKIFGCKISLNTGIGPIKSVMRPILASQIGQFQSRDEFYAAIFFTGSGPN